MIAEAEANWVRPPVDEGASTSSGAVTVSGVRIPYTATAGTLTIRDDDGKPTASIFYTAYTRDGSAPGTRPVTFFYNGGPGSASFWLHMGSFAPVRVTTANPEYIRPRPLWLRPQPAIADRQDRHGVHRRGRRGLVAAAGRQDRQGFLGRRSGCRCIR
jgi:hypothetical protein